MGWNELAVERDHPLVTGVDDDDARGGSVDGEYAYFVHSYYARPDDPDAVVATTEHGRRFPAVIASEDGPVFGTQFHPEKSGETGLTILRNFVDVCSLR
jgi:glutamine amidotransferase